MNRKEFQGFLKTHLNDYIIIRKYDISYSKQLLENMHDKPVQILSGKMIRRSELLIVKK